MEILQTIINRPNIDRFRISEFRIATGENPHVFFIAEFGYDAAGTFVKIKTERVRITNTDVIMSGGIVATANADGEFPEFPPGYQINPANEVISEINKGTFGGNPTCEGYIEAITKTLLSL